MHSFSHLRMGRILRREIVRRAHAVPNRVAFLLGNIRPDLSIKYRRIGHTRKESYEFLLQEIRELAQIPVYGFCGIRYSMRLGILCHYLCDYFCVVHRDDYEGTLRNHLKYEKVLDCYFREHKQSIVSSATEEEYDLSVDSKAIIGELTRTHDEYLGQGQHSLNDDVAQALRACIALTHRLVALSIEAGYEPVFA